MDSAKVEVDAKERGLLSPGIEKFKDGGSLEIPLVKPLAMTMV